MLTPDTRRPLRPVLLLSLFAVACGAPIPSVSPERPGQARMVFRSPTTVLETDSAGNHGQLYAGVMAVDVQLLLSSSDSIIARPLAYHMGRAQIAAPLNRRIAVSVDSTVRLFSPPYTRRPGPGSLALGIAILALPAIALTIATWCVMCP